MNSRTDRAFENQKHDTGATFGGLDTLMLTEPVLDHAHTFFPLCHSYHLLDCIDKKGPSADNLAVEEVSMRVMSFVALSLQKYAMQLCKDGLERFPDCCDLWASAIMLHMKNGDRDAAAKYYDGLKSAIDITQWSWRGFVACFEYLKGSDIPNNEQACRDILTQYRCAFPTDDYPLILMAKFEYELDNFYRCRRILTDLGGTTALQYLLTYQLRSGRYGDAIITSDKMLSIDPASFSQSELYGIRLKRLYALDMLFHRHLSEEPNGCTKEGKILLESYACMIEQADAVSPDDLQMLVCRMKALENELNAVSGGQ